MVKMGRFCKGGQQKGEWKESRQRRHETRGSVSHQCDKHSTLLGVWYTHRPMRYATARMANNKAEPNNVS